MTSLRLVTEDVDEYEHGLVTRRLEVGAVGDAADGVTNIAAGSLNLRLVAFDLGGGD